MLLKCVVTGSSGFVGKHLVKKLVSLGHEVLGIDKIPYSFEAAKTVCVDLLDMDVNLECDVLFHLAGITNAAYAQAHFRETIDSNEVALVNTLEHVKAGKVIFTSSAVVYGNQSLSNIPESAKLKPASFYGVSKMHAENIVRCYSKSFGIARFFNLYGEGQGAQYLIPSIFSQAEKGKISLWSGGDVRDFVFVEDAVDALLLLLEHNNLTLNVGTGIGRTALSVAEEINKAYNVPIECGKQSFEYSPSRLVSDNSVLRNLGWGPKVSFEEGIAKLISMRALVWTEKATEEAIKQNKL